MEMFRRSNKFFSNAEIIAIGYALAAPNLNYVIKKLKDYPDIFLITTWKEGNEKSVITKFYNILREIRRNQRITLIGYGVLIYDIPFLIQKLYFNQIDDLKNLNEFFHDLRIIDLRLVGLMYNNMRFSGSSLAETMKKIEYQDRILQKPKEFMLGSSISELYKQRKFKQIEEHLINDIKMTIYLYRALRNSIIKKLPKRK